MKKLLILLTVALAALQLSAAQVDVTTAQRKARNFLTNTFYAGKMMAPAALNPVLLKAEVGDIKTQKPVYYIFNTSTTFVVVAADDRAEEILMVGDRPLKDINNLAPGMQDMLGQYKDEIVFLQDHPGLKVDPIAATTIPSLKATTIGPLLTCNWDQEAPYYNQCKFTYSGTSYQCLTGCPATSASMVLYYWKYPTAATGTVPAYTGQLDISSSSYSTNYKTFTYSALSSTTFDWANMLDNYGTSSSSYTTAQGTAVATLMRYVGQAEEMMYGRNASGISVDDAQNVADMFTFFGYDSSTTRLVKKTSAYSGGTTLYTDTQWAALIQEEMNASRPIVFMAVSSSAGGHAFNVDGYNSSTNKYHVNFGWSGDGNAWCSLNSFGYSSYNFNVYQQMIIGIQPPSGSTTTPELTVNPTSLTFTGNTGETYTKTFTVTGTDLTSSVNISVSGTGYSVSPTTLTAAQAAAGATVTVTYKPTAAGTQTGTVTVASSGATSKTVSLSGTATAVPTITASPTSLSLSTTVGTSVTKTFTVTGANLTGAVYLSCSGTGFSIDKSNITRATATNGATVTVTYNPTAAGTHTGTVTLTSSGAETVTVNLNGTAVGVPTLTVSPTSLSFSTTVGESVTKTFNVSGADLQGAVSLSVSGTGFTINKTSITQATATSGTTVTVTYTPTAAGTHTGTVTLTSTGATSKTVTLSGTATTIPTITANPAALSFNTLVGTPVTKTFTVNGAYLSGAVSLALTGNEFAIDKTNITATAAASGATVTVTYNPAAFGTHTGTITLTSNGAEAVTVTLNGQADLVKYAPVMIPAVEDYINLTQFRADWTDATPEANVTSYTLEVSPKPTTPDTPDPVMLEDADFSSLSKVTSSSGGIANVVNSASNYLPTGWTAQSGLWIHDGFIISGYLSSTVRSFATKTYDFTGYDKVSIVMDAASYYSSYYGDAAINVSTSAGSQQVNMTSDANGTDNNFTTFTIVLDVAQSDNVTFAGVNVNSGANNLFAVKDIKIYAGDVNTGNATLMATETGDADYRLITGITDKFYTVENLTAEGTFLYRVKALYADGTESDWSNIEEVTLFQNGHGYELGDVNHDGNVSIKDVTELIDYLLGSGSDICTICADINQDGNVTIKDVTDLIDMLLGTGTASLKAPKSALLVEP